MVYRNIDDFIQVQGKIFEAVERGRVFPDSKTFVDCVPDKDPGEIVKAYREGCDLKAFVEEHFSLPRGEEEPLHPCTTAHEYISEMWDYLSREMKPVSRWDTLIGLPHPHIVPGGRFRENYYWDSYFVVLALVRAGMKERASELVENFAHLVDHYGFIPNGNRVYYLSRSQPPFFSLMADSVGKPMRELVEREYHFWMHGEELEEEAHGHVVRYKGHILGRYFDPLHSPRPESFREDAEHPEIVQAMRAACESGWDFSARWMADGKTFSTMDTLSILPIDLNCLLFVMEKKVAPERAKKRAHAIEELFWDGEYYRDIQWREERFTEVASLAGVFPLFVGVASEARAKKVAEVLKRDFLKAGGLVTTLVETGQQWDSPNGWAPLHYIACEGLRNYGHDALAEEIAKRWKKTCVDFFHKSGKMIEKYNVVDPEKDACDGEYEMQEGFGWTNAVMTLL